MRALNSKSECESITFTETPNSTSLFTYTPCCLIASFKSVGPEPRYFAKAFSKEDEKLSENM